jgi:hypothetical protein
MVSFSLQAAASYLRVLYVVLHEVCVHLCPLIVLRAASSIILID